MRVDSVYFPENFLEADSSYMEIVINAIQELKNKVESSKYFIKEVFFIRDVELYNKQVMPYYREDGCKGLYVNCFLGEFYSKDSTVINYRLGGKGTTLVMYINLCDTSASVLPPSRQ